MSGKQGALELRRLADMSEVGVEFRPTALVITTDLSFRNFTRLGRMLGNFADASKWWIGDWLLFGEGTFGEKAAQAEDATGRSYWTLANYRWVSSKVAIPRRRESLSHSAHVEVAAMPPEEQDTWLDQCEEHGWSVAEFRAAIRAAGKNGDQAAPQPAWSVEPDAEQVITLASRLIHEAQPNGDGRYLVDGEIMAQLRACFGEPE
jgi:hypothetical protein